MLLFYSIHYPGRNYTKDLHGVSASALLTICESLILRKIVTTTQAMVLTKRKIIMYSQFLSGTGDLVVSGISDRDIVFLL